MSRISTARATSFGTTGKLPAPPMVDKGAYRAQPYEIYPSVFPEFIVLSRTISIRKNLYYRYPVPQDHRSDRHAQEASRRKHQKGRGQRKGTSQLLPPSTPLPSPNIASRKQRQPLRSPPSRTRREQQPKTQNGPKAPSRTLRSPAPSIPLSTHL